MAIRPYRQGHLDSLCGIYAIVNATRLALASMKCEKFADYGHFFDFLIARLHARRLLYDTMANGLSSPGMSWLLSQADRWLARKYDVRLRYRRPFYRHTAPHRKIIRSIKRHLSEPNTSAIIVINGHPPDLHWTVVKNITAMSLTLFDSDGASRISLARSVCLLSCDVYLLKYGRSRGRGAASVMVGTPQ